MTVIKVWEPLHPQTSGGRYGNVFLGAAGDG